MFEDLIAIKNVPGIGTKSGREWLIKLDMDEEVIERFFIFNKKTRYTSLSYLWFNGSDETCDISISIGSISCMLSTKF